MSTEIENTEIKKIINCTLPLSLKILKEYDEYDFHRQKMDFLLTIRCINN